MNQEKLKYMFHGALDAAIQARSNWKLESDFRLQVVYFFALHLQSMWHENGEIINASGSLFFLFQSLGKPVLFSNEFWSNFPVLVRG